jgi:hypothetical protein
MKSILIRALFASMIILTTFSCQEDEDEPIVTQTQDVSGQWEFVINPDSVYQDTTLIKGHRETDFEVYSATAKELYLYQSGNEIVGYMGPVKMSGNINGNQLTLKLYDHQDGQYQPEPPVNEMTYVSDMILQLDGYHMMEGTGSYQPCPTYPNLNRYQPEERYGTGQLGR